MLDEVRSFRGIDRDSYIKSDCPDRSLEKRVTGQNIRR